MDPRHSGLTLTAAVGDSKRYRANGDRGGAAMGIDELMAHMWPAEPSMGGGGGGGG